MTKYDIYGIGAALVDTEIELSDEDLSNLNLDKGIMTLVDEDNQHKLVNALEGHLVASKKASGGSAANSIIAASYFGSRTYYSCKVADDENGSFYLNDLTEAGVAFGNHQRQQGITGKCLVMITPDAERTMATFLGISETLSLEEVNHEAIAQSRYVYIEGYLVTSETGKPAAIETRKAAQQHDVKVAVSLSDPAIVQHFKSGLDEIIGKKVDIIFCNKNEALHFIGTNELETAIEALKTVAHNFVVTCGANATLAFDGEQLFEIPCQPVKAIDTNGAGDMFAGAFLHAICNGEDFYTAGVFANHAAGRVVSQFGPRLKPKQHAEVLGSTTL